MSIPPRPQAQACSRPPSSIVAADRHIFWDSAGPVAICAALEPAIGIVALCVATLMPFFRRCRPVCRRTSCVGDTAGLYYAGAGGAARGPRPAPTPTPDNRPGDVRGGAWARASRAEKTAADASTARLAALESPPCAVLAGLARSGSDPTRVDSKVSLEKPRTKCSTAHSSSAGGDRGVDFFRDLEMERLDAVIVVQRSWLVEEEPARPRSDRDDGARTLGGEGAGTEAADRSSMPPSPT